MSFTAGFLVEETCLEHHFRVTDRSSVTMYASVRVSASHFVTRGKEFTWISLTFVPMPLASASLPNNGKRDELALHIRGIFSA